MGKASCYDFSSLGAFEFCFPFWDIMYLCGKWFGGFSGFSNAGI